MGVQIRAKGVHHFAIHRIYYLLRQIVDFSRVVKQRLLGWLWRLHPACRLFEDVSHIRWNRVVVFEHLFEHQKILRRFFIMLVLCYASRDKQNFAPSANNMAKTADHGRREEGLEFEVGAVAGCNVLVTISNR